MHISVSLKGGKKGKKKNLVFSLFQSFSPHDDMNFSLNSLLMFMMYYILAKKINK